MPNRERVGKVLVQDVLGAQQWDQRIGETVNMPVEDYDRVEQAADAIVERVAAAVDWDRLLMEASWRHLELHEDKQTPDRYYSEATGVCGVCLREALLQEEKGAPDWEKHPTAPLRHDKTDWATAVAEELEHRDAAHWHPYKEA